jgi:hypothetical protein
MKRISFILVTLCFVFFATAQTQVTLNPPQTTETKSAPLDKSPMDMAYFPVDYPVLKTQNKATQAPYMRVIYSRPQRDNRVIFGELIEYDKVWRLGANEATEIEFYKDVTIAGKKIAKGRYTLYAIPTPAKWTLIINKDTDTWGAFIYDEKKDILRTEVPVQTLTSPVEVFSMNFTKSDKGANLVIAWENVSVSLPIEVSATTSTTTTIKKTK